MKTNGTRARNGKPNGAKPSKKEASNEMQEKVKEKYVRINQLATSKKIPSELRKKALIAWSRGIRAQLQWLLDWEGQLRSNFSRKVSDKTINDRRSTFFLFFADLRTRGFKITNVLNLKSKHIEALLTHWQKKQLSSSTIVARLSHLRFFCKLIDKNGMVSDQEVLANKNADYKVAKRVTVAKRDKSWKQSTINMPAVIKSAFAISKVFGHEISMMDAFGLRLRECLMMQPHRQDLGSELLVDRGGKGGLIRRVPIETAEQRATLDAVKRFVARGDSISGRDHGTLKQVYSKAERGFASLEKKHPELADYTMHGLRHGAVHALLRRRGLPVPAAGDQIDQRLSEEQRARLAEGMKAFGHSRISVATAYTGSLVPPKKTKVKK